MAIPRMNRKTIDVALKIQEIATPVCALVRNDSSFERTTNEKIEKQEHLLLFFLDKAVYS